MNTFSVSLYVCGCGYRTTSPGNATKHRKVSCGTIISVSSVSMVLKESCDISCDIEKIKEQNEYKIKEIKEQFEYKIKKQTIKIKELESVNKRLQASLTKTTTIPDGDDETQDEGTGIIYFIVDKDLPDRGKIGRTKNTDVKRLKVRYSSFGNPDILCHWSTDIKEDENTLKILLRDAGCMKSNTEMISNIPLAREVFYEFIEM